VNHSRGRIVYSTTIACSSLLLFSIQPVITKAILPAFGGSAGIWVTAMLFFQIVLLLGYVYAFALTRLPPRLQSLIHGALLAFSLALLPVKPHLEWALPAGQSPLLSILSVLLASVGLPYFLLSSTSPLLQSWYAGSWTAALPWRLFALSNLVSVIALLAYPVLIEPNSTGSQQMLWWTTGYSVLVAFACIAAILHLSATRISSSAPPETSDGGNRPVLWISLAACASALWLAVANHLSQEVAPVPFLWVLPLSIYLFSFILCFESDRQWYRPALFRWLLPVAWIGGGYSIAAVQGLQWEISGFSLALFVWCMFCHGELARAKPRRRQDLTFFYLMLALGGALGGLFVAVAAPNLFTTYLELPIGIAASVLLAMPLIYGLTSKKRLIRMGVVACAAFALPVMIRDYGDLLHLRNFYGASRVTDDGSGDLASRSLYNGRTLHGVEFLSSAKSLLPTAYYGPESGVGQVLIAAGTTRRQVGVIGLGVGTLAAYGRAGDLFRFYEINPAVIQIASRYFHFLDRSPAKTEVVIGDGRLALQRESADTFDVLVLDAFSDDSIPVHLMTKEAFAVYFRLLRSGGVLAIHLTNRYIDLDPVVDALAASFQKRVTHIHSQANPSQHILDTDWALISGHEDSPPATARPQRLWTDDYSNLFQVLK
jgi:SAM-dependent methyltransferase